jgi:hypothetical protein
MSKKELETFKKDGVVKSKNNDNKIKFFTEYPYRGKVHIFKCFNSLKPLFTTKPDYMVLFRTKGGIIHEEIEKCKNKGTAHKHTDELEIFNMYYHNEYTNNDLNIVGVYDYNEFNRFCKDKYSKMGPVSIYAIDFKKNINTAKILEELNLYTRN